MNSLSMILVSVLKKPCSCCRCWANRFASQRSSFHSLCWAPVMIMGSMEKKRADNLAIAQQCSLGPRTSFVIIEDGVQHRRSVVSLRDVFTCTLGELLYCTLMSQRSETARKKKTNGPGIHKTFGIF